MGSGAGGRCIGRLRFRPAVLYVVSNTPADVVVDDGKVRGRTYSVIRVPQPNDMWAPHVIRVSAEGHRPEQHEVRLQAGQLKQIEVKLEREVAPPG